MNTKHSLLKAASAYHLITKKYYLTFVLSFVVLTT